MALFLNVKPTLAEIYDAIIFPVPSRRKIRGSPPRVKFPFLLHQHPKCAKVKHMTRTSFQISANLKSYFWRGTSLLVILLIGCHSAVWAEGISGYFFGDYYYSAKSHDSALENRSGFQYRRIYFTYDKGMSDELSTRLRLEMNSPSFPAANEKKRLEPFVKHAYLKWKSPAWRTATYFGLSGTPTWANVEKVWGYRHVTKTLLDLQKLAGSTDFGAAVKGNIDAEKKLSYHLMVANGMGTSGEIDQNKKVYLSVAARPISGVVAEVYADVGDTEGGLNQRTVQGFLGYQHDIFRLGVQAANQTREQDDNAEDLNLTGISVFAAAQITENRVWGFARFDRMFSANPDGERISYTPYSDTAKSNTIIIGLDWTVIKDLNIIPNLFLVFYDQPGAGDKPNTDIMPRLTAFFRY